MKDLPIEVDGCPHIDQKVGNLELAALERGSGWAPPA
jgi:hypothetical protein